MVGGSSLGYDKLGRCCGISLTDCIGGGPVALIIMSVISSVLFGLFRVAWAQGMLEPDYSPPGPCHYLGLFCISIKVIRDRCEVRLTSESTRMNHSSSILGLPLSLKESSKSDESLSSPIALSST